MTDVPTAEREAVEKAWRLLNLQADTMLKRAQTRTQVWKVAVGAFVADGLLVALTAALTGFLVLAMVEPPTTMRTAPAPSTGPDAPVRRRTSSGTGCRRHDRGGRANG